MFNRILGKTGMHSASLSLSWKDRFPQWVPGTPATKTIQHRKATMAETKMTETKMNENKVTAIQ